MTGTAPLTEPGIAPPGVAPGDVPPSRTTDGSAPAPVTPDHTGAPVPPPRPRAAGKPGSAGAVLLAYLTEHVDRLAAEERRARADEPDAVHQLRVNARRLRSALQAYRPLLDRERTEPLVDALREFGRRMAPARDGEVLEERIGSGLAELPPELRLGPVQALATRHFARVGADARAGVLAELDGEHFARLRARLEDLLVDPPLTKRARRPARRELPAVVRRTARRLARAVETATDPDAEHRDEAVHAARKAAKRLRYATDVATPAVGKSATRFASGLKAFQKALGEHQDTVVARGVLRELAAQAHGAGENGFAFGVLYARDEARAARIEEELPALWAQAWTKKNRKWLG